MTEKPTKSLTREYTTDLYGATQGVHRDHLRSALLC